MGFALLLAVLQPAVIVTLPPPPAAQALQEFAVVASTNFPTQRLTAAEVRQIYLGEKRFLGGLRLKPLEPKQSSDRDHFLEKVIKMQRQAFKLHWLSKIFQEGTAPPETVEPQAMLARIKERPGTIGYVRLQDARADPALRVLLVIDGENAP